MQSARYVMLCNAIDGAKDSLPTLKILCGAREIPLERLMLLATFIRQVTLPIFYCTSGRLANSCDRLIINERVHRINGNM